jgi:hypothetical protein
VSISAVSATSSFFVPVGSGAFERLIIVGGYGPTAVSLKLGPLCNT